MSPEPNRARRQRVYGLVTLALVCIVGLVAMSAMLAKGHEELSRKVYKFPHKTLFHLAKAQTRFRRLDLDADGVYDFATSVGELEEAGLITRTLGSGELEGYRYEVVRAEGGEWAAVAEPVQITSETHLFYFVDQSFIVRARSGSRATASSKVYWSPREQTWR